MMKPSVTSDPYAVLGLARGCGEAEVRRRYLELVRQYPPDRAPDRFTEIRQAYEKLRDPVVRVESKLFELESSGTVTEVIADLRQRLRARRFPTQTLLSLADPC
jgi:curved DNA-binding protein CbpA